MPDLALYHHTCPSQSVGSKNSNLPGNKTRFRGDTGIFMTIAKDRTTWVKVWGLPPGVGVEGVDGS